MDNFLKAISAEALARAESKEIEERKEKDRQNRLKLEQERVLETRCVVCKKRYGVHSHHILGRGGIKIIDKPLQSKKYSNFLKNNPKMQVKVCFECHSLEKGLDPLKRDKFLKRAFLEAGGEITGEGWVFTHAIGRIIAPKGHNSPVIFLEEKENE